MNCDVVTSDCSKVSRTLCGLTQYERSNPRRFCKKEFPKEPLDRMKTSEKAAEIPIEYRPNGLELLDEDCGWVDLGSRSRLLMTGSDAVRFTDSFTTASVSKLLAGQGTESFILDSHGWVLWFVQILRTEEGVLIDADPGVSGALREHLERYHIRESFESVDETLEYQSMYIGGPMARSRLEKLLPQSLPDQALDHRVVVVSGDSIRIECVDWTGTEGFVLFMKSDCFQKMESILLQIQISTVSREAFETKRIEYGRPSAVDIPGKTLPQELGRNSQAISFTKGCYLGQETVARIDAMGHVNKRIVCLSILSNEIPEPGTSVTMQGSTVGVVGSSCRWRTTGKILSLAMLHNRASAEMSGLQVDVGGSLKSVTIEQTTLPTRAPA